MMNNALGPDYSLREQSALMGLSIAQATPEIKVCPSGRDA
jgi:hypothetical protein